MESKEHDLIPIEDAARDLSIEPKRLLGYCLSPKPWMPIAGRTPEGVMVYGWSLRHVAASAASAVKNP